MESVNENDDMHVEQRDNACMSATEVESTTDVGTTILPEIPNTINPLSEEKRNIFSDCQETVQKHLGGGHIIHSEDSLVDICPLVENQRIEYGFIPLVLFEKLCNSEISTDIRITAIQQLDTLLQKTTSSTPLLPHISQIVSLFCSLLMETDVDITLCTARTLQRLLSVVAMNIDSQLPQLLKALFVKLGDSDIICHADLLCTLYQTLNSLICSASCREMLSNLLECLENTNSDKGRNVGIAICSTLLIKRDDLANIDLTHSIRTLVNFLEEQNHEIKMLVVESFAILHDVLGDVLGHYLSATPISPVDLQLLEKRFTQGHYPQLGSNGQTQFKQLPLLSSQSLTQNKPEEDIPCAKSAFRKLSVDVGSNEFHGKRNIRPLTSCDTHERYNESNAGLWLTYDEMEWNDKDVHRPCSSTKSEPLTAPSRLNFYCESPSDTHGDVQVSISQSGFVSPSHYQTRSPTKRSVLRRKATMSMSLANLKNKLPVKPKRATSALPRPQRSVHSSKSRMKDPKTDSFLYIHRGKGLERRDSFKQFDFEPLESSTLRRRSRKGESTNQPFERSFRERPKTRAATSCTERGKISTCSTPEAVYCPVSEMTPSSSPAKELQGSLRNIKSLKWSDRFSALTSFRKLAYFHKKIVNPHVRSVVSAVCQEVDSLRSSLSRNAIMCIEVLFQSFPHSLENDLDQVVPALMKRAGELSNDFLCNQAQQALTIIISSMPPSRSLPAFLICATNKNPHVRAQTCMFLEKIIENFGKRIFHSRGRDKLIQVLGVFLEEASADTRSNARKALIRLSSLNSGLDVCFRGNLKRILPHQQYIKVTKVFDEETNEEAHSSLLSPKSFMNTSQHSKSLTRVRSVARKQVSLAKSLERSTSCFSGNREKEENSHIRGLQEGCYDPEHSVQLENICTWLVSNDWKIRSRNITALVEFITRNQVFSKANASKIMSELTMRFDDVNKKNAARAMTGFNKILPIFEDCMEPYLLSLMQMISQNLASSTMNVKKCADVTMDSLMKHVDPLLLFRPCSQIVMVGSDRVKPAMIRKVIDIMRLTAQLKSSESLISKYVVPAAFSLLEDSKSAVRVMNQKLLHALQTRMGAAFIEHPMLHKLKSSQRRKLDDILNKR